MCIVCKVKGGLYLMCDDMCEWYVIFNVCGWFVSYWLCEYGGFGWSVV